MGLVFCALVIPKAMITLNKLEMIDCEFASECNDRPIYLWMQIGLSPSTSYHLNSSFDPAPSCSVIKL